MGRRDEEMEREFAFHAEREARERGGAPRGLAREEHWKETARAERSWAALAAWGRDFRLALRGLRRAPGFAAAAMVILGLGIGANTAVFSVVEAVVLRPLPFPQPERLALVWRTDLRHPGSRFTQSYPDFQDLAASPELAAAASYTVTDVPLTGLGEATHVRAAEVSAKFFDVLGIRAAYGRTFLPGENRPGGTDGLDAVVFGDALARAKFGSPGAAVGRAVTMDGRRCRIVGVMPAGFQFPLDNHEDAWLTEASLQVGPDSMASQRAAHLFEMVVRRGPGTTEAGLARGLATLAGRLARQYPNADGHLGEEAVGVLASYTADARPVLWLLLGAVGCVLLIACVNVAGLMLARSVRRRPEFALRAALGASRGAVLRQLACESLAVGLAGAALGLGMAAVAARGLGAWGPRDLVRLGQARVSPPVLLFGLGLGVATALLFGLFPALELLRAERGQRLGDVMQAGARGLGGGGRGRWRKGLVGAQFGLAVAVLVGALLLLRSLDRLEHAPLGFTADNVLTATINIPDARYPAPGQQGQFFDQLVARVRQQPGVAAAGAAFPMPLSGNNIGVGMDRPDHPLPQAEQPVVRVGVVTPGYFTTLGIPLLRGRAFTEADRHGAPEVAVVNRAFARRYFAGVAAIGGRIKPGIGAYDGPTPVRTIVGVVGDTKQTSLAQAQPPMVYLPQLQVPFDGFVLAVRARPGAEALAAGAVRRVVRGLDADVPVFDLAPLEDKVSASAAGARFDAVLLGVFAGLALLLAAVGLYAVMAQAVAQRRREIGVRVALGAGRGEISGMVVREGMAMAAVGLGCGLVAAWLLTRGLAAVLSANLYATSALDPVSFFGAPLLLVAVAWLACAVPARRAAKADPVSALRLD